jgi:hypothetical protein
MARKVARRAAKQFAKRGVVVLAGENLQIAKGDGDGPGQAYIHAIPGWKREVARRLDGLVVRAWRGLVEVVRWRW